MMIGEYYNIETIIYGDSSRFFFWNIAVSKVIVPKNQFFRTEGRKENESVFVHFSGVMGRGGLAKFIDWSPDLAQKPLFF